ncbi:uncharacterized protein LJ206_008775 isoform 1-T1 [Theristicus caerulescens]
MASEQPQVSDYHRVNHIQWPLLEVKTWTVEFAELPQKYFISERTTAESPGDALALFCNGKHDFARSSQRCLEEFAAFLGPEAVMGNTSWLHKRLLKSSICFQIYIHAF